MILDKNGKLINDFNTKLLRQAADSILEAFSKELKWPVTLYDQFGKQISKGETITFKRYNKFEVKK
jgi:hypothetical protein